MRSWSKCASHPPRLGICHVSRHVQEGMHVHIQEGMHVHVQEGMHELRPGGAWMSCG